MVDGTLAGAQWNLSGMAVWPASSGNHAAPENPVSGPVKVLDSDVEPT